MVREIEYEKWIEWPHARLRAERVIDSGTVVRFVVRLEYEIDDEWQPVVRFDHDTGSEGGHDIRDEGHHMDVYRDGEKHRSKPVFPLYRSPKRPATANDTLPSGQRTSYGGSDSARTFAPSDRRLRRTSPG